MKEKRFTAWTTALIIGIIGAIVGCGDIDSYSVNPRHVLSFSTDTVSFDTVFTTIGSVTGSFMIYNRNDEALKIERIMLASGGRSSFRINVDGRRGDSFNDIPIWQKDSLYVAVEVTVDPNDDDLPFVIHDSVVFVTNGVTQSVLLEAYGQNAYILRGGVIFAHDTTLAANRPYLVYDSVMITEGATVKISEGTSFYMHNKAKWLIDGSLKIDGSQDRPVTFRGDRLNNFSTLVSYDRISAQWNGMFFGATSFGNELNYAMIRNGISGLTFAESTPDSLKMNIRYSQIINMESDVLRAVNCRIEASDSEFSNAGRYLVMLAGGVYRFTHCTMTNYMPSEMISYNRRLFRCLTLTDKPVYDDISTSGNDSRIFSLQQAYFDNCIIDGNLQIDNQKDYSGEISFVTDEQYIDGHDEHFNYRFNHCFVKTKHTENKRFIETLFAESPKYIKSSELNEYRKSDYIFDFRLADESSVIGKADRAVAEQHSIDRYGVSRLTSVGSPSIGAYEYVPQEKPQ